MDFSAMKDRLVGHRQMAEQQIKYIKEHPDLSLKELHERIYDYVLYKYNLFGEVSEVTALSDLAELSVAKAIRLSREQSIAYDNKASCDGATSAMNKKVLLLMAIQRELEIKFPIDRVVQIKSTDILAEEVQKQLQNDRSFRKE